MKKTIACLTALVISAASFGEAIQFDLDDPKGVNNIVFLLDAPLESINGTATGITGMVSFDPGNPEATSGKVVVAVKSMRVDNGKLQEHLLGGRWMNAEAFPEISFELASLSDVDQDGNKIEAIAHGSMTIKGETKEIEVPVSLTFLEGMLEQRQRVPGDLLVIRSSFSVKRSDFGVNAGQMEDKVADEVELRLSLAGIAPE